MLHGIIARPRATSLRTNSGVISARMSAPNALPACAKASEFRGNSNPEYRISKESLEFRISELEFVSDFGFRVSDLSEPDWRFNSRPMFSRSAMNSISGVMIPWRAYQSCVTGCDFARRTFRREGAPSPSNAGRWTACPSVALCEGGLSVGRFLFACLACASESQPSSIG